MCNQKSCLVVVDVQNDFCPNGALAVKNGDEIVPFINEIAKTGGHDFIVTTQDLHPQKHISFASYHNQEPFTEVKGKIVWADHCVKDTKGAELHKDLKLNVDMNIIKGYKEDEDSYSAFGGITDTKEDIKSLDSYLKDNDIKHLTIVGLATDFCVKATAIDAKKLGYDVIILDKGTKEVSDKTETYKEFVNLGISILFDSGYTDIVDSIEMFPSTKI